MQSLHVRFIFQLSIPLQGDFQGSYSFDIASDGIGILMKGQNLVDQWYYQVQLQSCDDGAVLDATKGLTWPKRNFYVLQTKENTQVEGLILRLKILHGTFDFRKVKKRAIRFNVNCFHSGTFVGRGTSEICQLLPKKRTASDSDVNGEVVIPIIWSQSHEPHQEIPLIEPLLNRNKQTDEFHSSDEEPPKKRQRVEPREPQQLASDESISLHAFHNTNTKDYDVGAVYESPIDESADAELSPYYTHHDQLELASHTDIMNFESDTLAHNMAMAPQHENYMVLYNGNAEVVGNFRALNFYKASDITIKEDIRLLTEDRDPRDVILKIDGVEYKFKDNVQHSTNKRFVGYIAQQIESVVPEAVQLIDGILHVNYESLIPYLSESIKQNYNDIKGLKSESEQIRQLLDSLYDEFISKDPGVKKTVAPYVNTYSVRRYRKWITALALVPLVLLLGAAMGILLTLNYKDPTPYTPPGHIEPLANVTETIVPPNNTTLMHPDRSPLMKFFEALNGTNWLHNTGWGSVKPVCGWEGVFCSDNRVVDVTLGRNNLVGTLPEELGDLKFLESISLSGNSLLGTIPESLWSLPLKRLRLSQNKDLTGTVPNAFHGLFLDLGGCNFRGTIPSTLFEGGVLHLNLSSNALVGTIPEPPSGTLALYDLDLSHNKLTGTIPKMIISTKLDLSYNQLSGNLTALMEHLTPTELDLSHNELDGELLLNMDMTLPSQRIDLSYNKFSSSTYDPVFNVTVASCDVSHNEFKCPISKWLETHCKASCN